MSERLKKGYLQWRCRRGTKELDVILNFFLDMRYDYLTNIELQNFDELLNSQDTILWYWLSGQKQPDEKLVRDLVANIRKVKELNAED